MSRPEKVHRSGRQKRAVGNRSPGLRPTKAAPENDSGFVKEVAKNPEVVKKIISYARKIAPDLSISPGDNLFPVLCRVIIHSVKTGYEIAQKGKVKK